MGGFFPKYRRNLLLLAFLPYLILAIGSQGIHEVTHPHHLHAQYSDPHHFCNNEGLSYHSERSDHNSGVSHDEDTCLICQWVKYSPQTIQTNSTGFDTLTGGFDTFHYRVILSILYTDNNLSRAPPVVPS
jgi:hypothetical protein